MPGSDDKKFEATSPSAPALPPQNSTNEPPNALDILRNASARSYLDGERPGVWDRLWREGKKREERKADVAKTIESSAKPPMAEPNPRKTGFSMSLDDALFWIGLTCFGSGSGVMFEHPAGILLVFFGVALLAWANRGHMPKPPLRLAAFYFAVAVTCALVGWQTWMYFHPQTSSNVEVVTAPTAPPNQPPGKREIIDTTPEYLMGLYQDKSTFQGDQLLKPFVGKWMRLTQTINDITENQIWSNLPSAKARQIVMYFDDTSKLATVQVKQKVSTLCQIAGAKVNWLFLAHCEFESK